jgi:hypothetical protein
LGVNPLLSGQDFPLNQSLTLAMLWLFPGVKRKFVSSPMYLRYLGMIYFIASINIRRFPKIGLPP